MRLCIHIFCAGLLSIASLLGQTVSPAAKLTSCTFHHIGDHFSGSCGPLFDQTPQMTLKRAAALSSGIWRDDVKPKYIWAGDMTDAGYPNDLLELEVDPGGQGVLRTEYGWFPVSHFTLKGKMQFSLDASQEVPPSDVDLKILQRADALLSSVAVWNREDNRECPKGKTKRSIYCALTEAEADVAGGSSHRRPAAEIVRKIVDARTSTRKYHHRLMEYNNDPTTSLQDVRTLFAEAEQRVKAGLPQ